MLVRALGCRPRQPRIAGPARASATPRRPAAAAAQCAGGAARPRGVRGGGARAGRLGRGAGGLRIAARHRTREAARRAHADPRDGERGAASSVISPPSSRTRRRRGMQLGARAHAQGRAFPRGQADDAREAALAGGDVGPAAAAPSHPGGEMRRRTRRPTGPRRRRGAGAAEAGRRLDPIAKHTQAGPRRAAHPPLVTMRVQPEVISYAWTLWQGRSSGWNPADSTLWWMLGPDGVKRRGALGEDVLMRPSRQACILIGVLTCAVITGAVTYRFLGRRRRQTCQRTWLTSDSESRSRSISIQTRHLSEGPGAAAGRR